LEDGITFEGECQFGKKKLVKIVGGGEKWKDLYYKKLAEGKKAVSDFQGPFEKKRKTNKSGHLNKKMKTGVIAWTETLNKKKRHRSHHASHFTNSFLRRGEKRRAWKKSPGEKKNNINGEEREGSTCVAGSQPKEKRGNGREVADLRLPQ